MLRWTEKARQEQSERTKALKIWEHSTGPKTEAGKAKSSTNATKHGMYNKDIKHLLKLLARQRAFVREVKKMTDPITRGWF